MHTMKKALLVISYWILNLSLPYVVFSIIAATLGAPSWILILPVFILAAPAGAFIAAYKCNKCGSPVYTIAHMKAAPSGANKLSFQRFENCPECRSPL